MVTANATRDELRPLTLRPGFLAALALLGVMLVTNVDARPYGVAFWNQIHDFSANYNAQTTDLQALAGGANYTYAGLPGADGEVYRNFFLNAAGVQCAGGTAADRHVPGVPGAGWVDFTAADLTDITDGSWHCAPTSFGMADNYWWSNGLQEVDTISAWATLLDTTDVNPALNAGDHRLHYGSRVADNIAAVPQRTPGAPWGGRYSTVQQTYNPVGVNYPVNTTLYMGEIRAGRPMKTGDTGHAVLGVDWNSTDMITNDPGTGAAGTVPWTGVFDHTAVRPRPIAPPPPGHRVFFSNDNFGTGQANVQAVGGDPGDVFGSDRNRRYGIIENDVDLGLVQSTAANPDYYVAGRNFTSGNEIPFDIDGLDVLETRTPIASFNYSLDHGDPNPHGWMPDSGIAGDPTIEELEILRVDRVTPWYTAGHMRGTVRVVRPTGETELGLNRYETTLGPGNLLDDDVDALELEFGASVDMLFSADFVDTRVFPEYRAAAGGGDYYELPGLDPTDVYQAGGGAFSLFVDGENAIFLNDGVDIDALQFIVLGDHDGVDALLFSIDADAPSRLDRANNILDPGTVYLSYLNGTPPIPFLGLGGDVDGLVAGTVPEPMTFVLVGAGVASVLTHGRRRARKGVAAPI